MKSLPPACLTARVDPTFSAHKRRAGGRIAESIPGRKELIPDAIGAVDRGDKTVWRPRADQREGKARRRMLRLQRRERRLHRVETGPLDEHRGVREAAIGSVRGAPGASHRKSG